MRIVNTIVKSVSTPLTFPGQSPPATDSVMFRDPDIKATVIIDTKVRPCKVKPGESIDLVKDGRTLLGIRAVACLSNCEFAGKPVEEGGCALFSRS